MSLPRRSATAFCPSCSKDSPASLSIGTTRVVEVLDNGLMARKVERLRDVEQILEERDAKHKGHVPEEPND